MPYTRRTSTAARPRPARRGHPARQRSPPGVTDVLHGSEINSASASSAFCGKRSHQVRRLIAGPEVLVCDECVAVCVVVLEDEIGPNWHERQDSG
jgi:hypothetical protein